MLGRVVACGYYERLGDLVLEERREVHIIEAFAADYRQTVALFVYRERGERRA